jgi:4-hydroxy-2-oxoheptanedioate aldolase
MTYPTALTTTNSNPRLRLLQGLKAGTKPVMTFMGLPSVRTAQIVALTGVDVSLAASSQECANPPQSIILDCEHGHISDDSMHNSVAAISALNVSPVIRIRAPLPDLIKRALDTGAQCVTPTRCSETLS